MICAILKKKKNLDSIYPMCQDYKEYHSILKKNLDSLFYLEWFVPWLQGSP